MSKATLSVACEGRGDDTHQVKARQLARALALPLDDGVSSHVLRVGENGLLILIERKSGVAVSADFASPRLLYRLRQGMRREMLVRAVSVKGGALPTVVDATAGFGQDAFLLAAAGHEVTLIEQSPLVSALLDSALTCAKNSDDASIRQTAARMTLITGDSIERLATIHPLPVVVTLDPMFPQRNKSARVGKNMAMLQDILGHSTAVESESALLAAARSAALDKVVVKRPRLAPPLAGCEPDWQHIGRSSRFDVYRSMRRSMSS